MSTLEELTTMAVNLANTTMTTGMSPISSTQVTTSFTDLEKTCSEYYQNNTGFIIKDYEGIPENLLINVVVFAALLVVFTFLRYVGDYGRFGLIKNDEEK